MINARKILVINMSFMTQKMKLIKIIQMKTKKLGTNKSVMMILMRIRV